MSSETVTAAPATRDALLAAAGRVFAEHGFAAATVRAICAAAGANVAAVNYHFGSKDRLYLEVLRAGFQRARRRYPEDFGLNPDATAAERLHAFVRSLLFRLFDPSPDACHWPLLAREMIEPTAALDALVAEQVRPMAGLMQAIIAELLGPAAPREQIRRAACSLVGQCLFYRHARAVVTRVFPEQGFAPADLETLARHITRFSLAGLRALRDPRAAVPATLRTRPPARRRN